MVPNYNLYELKNVINYYQINSFMIKDIYLNKNSLASAAANNDPQTAITTDLFNYDN